MSDALPPYFAYGSNMASSQMAARCPGATLLGVARLPDYRLAFDAWSDRRGGLVADALPAPGRDLWGVLWDVNDAHAAALDRYEGVARGQYRRENVSVQTATGEPVEAFAYIICDPGEEGPTTEGYRDILLEGAREHRLPPACVKAIEAVPTHPPRPGPRPRTACASPPPARY